MGEQLATALARLHRLPLESLRDGARPGDSSDRGHISAVGRGLAARIGAQRAAHRALSPWPANGSSTTWSTSSHRGDSALLQGDVGLHNLLVDGDRSLRWSTGRRRPRARRRVSWRRPGRPAPRSWRGEFIQAYLAAGGPPEATDERSVPLPGLLRPRRGHVSRTGGDLFRTGAKRGPPHGALRSRRPLPRPAQSGARLGGRFGPRLRPHRRRRRRGLWRGLWRGCVANVLRYVVANHKMSSFRSLFARGP